MPWNYKQYAVDFDGDGKRDIWNTEADALASIANFLKALGWNDDLTWGGPSCYHEILTLRWQMEKRVDLCRNGMRWAFGG